jgi:uncharacterized membrane protein HdeD (DUF308 family)
MAIIIPAPIPRVRWFVGVGTILVLLGIVATANLFLSAMAATFFVGASMVGGGVLMLAHAFQVRPLRWALFWVLAGALYLFAAMTFAWDPLLGASFVVLLLVLFLGASGLARLAIAIAWRREGKAWTFASGLISVVAAILIGLGWPQNSPEVLGLILAFDLLFQGLMLIAIGFALSNALTNAES